MKTIICRTITDVLMLTEMLVDFIVVDVVNVDVG
jgi:hypothetical protein